MKKIVFFTGNRAEFGLQSPVIDEIIKRRNFDYKLIISGSHLDSGFGKTINEINIKKYKILGKVKINKIQKIEYTPNNISLIIKDVTKLLKKYSPDIFVAFADRFETFGTVIAASMMNICVAHVEGGDITNGGTFDDNIRHAITKLSHIHFTSTDEAKKIVLKLGEEKRRIFNVGFTGLDNIKNKNLGDFFYLKKKYKIDIEKQTILFTYHPLTSNFLNNIESIRGPIQFLKKNEHKFNIILTFPNNDLGSNEIIKYINKNIKKNKSIQVFKSLGGYDYLSFMKLCLKNSRALIVMGNSSSGIKETMSFKCPVVNIGSRQKGRTKGCNVINVNANISEIEKAIKKINSDNDFIKKIRSSKNIYGDGKSAKRIVDIISKIKLDSTLINKLHYEK